MHHAPCEPAYSERVSLSFCVSRAPTTHCHADTRKAYQAGILLQHQIISFRNGKLNNRRVAALKKFGLVFPPVSLQAPKPAKVPGCVFASLQHRLEESPGTAAAGALNKTLLATEAPPFHVPKQEQQLLWKNLTQKVIFLFSSYVLTTSRNGSFRVFKRDP